MRMTTRSTKRALLTSIMSMLLCVAMLAGTTFAWFTDSVTSSNNVITSGNLDVTFEYWDDVAGDWADVEGKSSIFDPNALWEPGYTEVIYLKVANIGSLALKYQLGVNIVSETGSTNVLGNTFKLSDYIYFDVKEMSEAEYARFADRAAAMAIATEKTKISAGYSKDSVLLAGNPAPTEYVALVVYMPEWVGNEANYDSKVAAAPQINLGLNVLATQYTKEADSFDEKYDEDATYIPAWDGSVGEVPAETDGKITITSPAEMAALSAAVNAGTSYAGKTVVLNADINLDNVAWAPIGTCDSASYFQGTFDGNGHTIYNLSVDNSADGYMYSTAGLFGWIDAASATIKNLKIDGATVKGSHWVGVIAGYMTGDIVNCSVTNATVVGVNVNDDANGDKVGGIVGYMNTGAGMLEGNTVSNSVIAGYRDVAGLAGAVATTNTVKNNTVKDVTVIYQKDYVGEIVSPKTAVVVDNTNVATNVTVKNNTMVLDPVTGLYYNGKASWATYYLMDAEDLTVAAEKFAFPGVLSEANAATFELMNDIDLAGQVWTPWDAMWLVFNGNGHTISNVNCATARKSGFFGYAGALTINDLTLENVTSVGSQVGTFAAAGEALKINNSFLKGTNSVSFTATEEEWNGIGAITGVLTESTINVEIVADTVVMLAKNAFTTDPECTYVDELTGYISANNGVVTNNGTVAFAIANARDLAGIANGGLYMLVNDIDMSSETWTPVAVNRKNLVLDGNNHKIMNLTTEANTAALIGSGSFSNITIKNLSVVDSSFTSHGTAGGNGAAALVAYADGLYGLTVDNVTIDNCDFVADGAGQGYAGAVYGWASGTYGSTEAPVSISNVTVANCEFTTCGSVGAIIGHASSNDDMVATIANCKVVDNKITYAENKGKSKAGIVVGTVNGAQLSISNIDESGNTVTNVGVANTKLYGRTSFMGNGKLTIDGVAIQ
ncbi:MAG: hypothetical protein IJW16_04845 [Clostridia bacterium]|nr:hypothetical protein [Clostridia bacterium]